jgi:hypothetical protein
MRKKEEWGRGTRDPLRPCYVVAGIEGKVTRVGASKPGGERVSMGEFRLHLIARVFFNIGLGGSIRFGCAANGQRALP